MSPLTVRGGPMETKAVGVRRRGRAARLVGAAALVLGLLVIGDALYIASALWPDWSRLASGPIPKSNVMDEYERASAADRPALRWSPVALETLSKSLVQALVIAEDARFWSHGGIDLIALKEAIAHNLRAGRVATGASTISQQTVKNLFLTHARDPLRKWHELVLTLAMESRLEKARILEIYLNIAEFGPGLYGVEAAAQAYFGVRAAALDPRQAVELVVSLPHPVSHNPASRSDRFRQRADRVFRLLEQFPGEAEAELRTHASNLRRVRTD